MADRVTFRLPGGKLARKYSVRDDGPWDGVAYSDGSCNPETGSGSWAAVAWWSRPRLGVSRSGMIASTDSNKAELVAMGQGLSMLPSGRVLLRSDSIQALIWAQRAWGWRDRPPLWRNLHGADLDALGVIVESLSEIAGDVTLQWVPGHCGDKGNDLADSEAVRSRLKQEARTVRVSVDCPLSLSVSRN